MRKTLELDVTTDKLRGIDQALDPGGIGTFVVRNVLDSEQVQLMQSEIFEPGRLQWREDRKPYHNDRHMLIIQNHMTSALKLTRGDAAMVERVPHMRALAANIQGLITSLAPVFPSLASWEADEMSVHRYDDQEVGLSFHKDNLRFFGLIAVLTVEGASDVAVLDERNEPHYIPVGEGDLNLTRATGLYPSTNEAGKPINLCPDHGVYNLRTPYRTSFIVRANSVPNEPIPGFVYANWQPETPAQET